MNPRLTEEEQENNYLDSVDQSKQQAQLSNRINSVKKIETDTYIETASKTSMKNVLSKHRGGTIQPKSSERTTFNFKRDQLLVNNDLKFRNTKKNTTIRAQDYFS